MSLRAITRRNEPCPWFVGPDAVRLPAPDQPPTQCPAVAGRRSCSPWPTGRAERTSIDPLRDPIYQALIVDHGLGWRPTANGDGAGLIWSQIKDAVSGEQMTGDPMLAAVRQIAYEVSETVSGQLSAILPDWSEHP